uniref:Cell division cycle 25C n=1 Tax=Rousettus aegyptiacus TaxID=9407 RepID=A0A7J8FGA3_ROUAE|nr:cell division cycle 25C [Rousettus aegyptiacus]
MKYLGSPITTVPKLDENPEQGENQAEEILGESMEFSLEDQEEVKGLCLKKTVSFRDINAIQMLEEDPNQGYLTGDFSKVSVVAPLLYFSESFWV